MKKFDKRKTLQLILTMILAGSSIFIILSDTELYQLVGRDPQIRILCILLWLSLVLSFLFIFIDFSLISALKRDYRELDFAVSSDPVSGIANRYSCDALVEKYLNQPLPADTGCIMFSLANIQDVNRLHGRAAGNILIRSFSGILQSASRELCFVGRNGGNCFMAFFENSSEEKMGIFLNRVADKTERHNGFASSQPIRYRYGAVWNGASNIQTITDLIALSNKRIYDEDVSETHK